jgi:sigma-B regulation protein RsbU (phosphoserine phosphatase)
MISLGNITINDQVSINNARKKIFRVFEMLTDDLIAATRLATATSEMCKLMSCQATTFKISLEIFDTSEKPAVSIVFVDKKKLPGEDLLNNFFDKVSFSKASDGRRLVHAIKYLPPKSLLKQDIIPRLKSTVERKSNDELMNELQSKNIELQESFENLRKTKSAKERMETELNIGKDIQMSMLPLVFPPFPDRKDLDIFAVLKPAREVGGDFYDFFFIDEGRLCFCVGDVSGKGVPAALFMAMTKTLIKSRATNDLSPASILTHVNDELSEDNKSCMFVTLFLGIINIIDSELIYTNAGHNPPFIKHGNQTLECLDGRHGPVIGAVSGMAYKEDKTSLAKKDLLFLFTDGVTEAMDPDSNLYSDKRLEDLLSLREYDSVNDIVNSTASDVKEFENGAEQTDDITILAIEFLGQPEGKSVQNLIITIRNSLSEIDNVSQRFDTFAEHCGIPKTLCQKVNIVFDELLNNIISYAYNDNNEHDIIIELEFLGDRLSIIIIDDGIPFNPFEAKKPDTELSLEEREIGGLGVHLVRKLMDKVSYKRQVDKNVISLTKQIPV